MAFHLLLHQVTEVPFAAQQDFPLHGSLEVRVDAWGVAGRTRENGKGPAGGTGPSAKCGLLWGLRGYLGDFRKCCEINCECAASVALFVAAKKLRSLLLKNVMGEGHDK